MLSGSSSDVKSATPERHPSSSRPRYADYQLTVQYQHGLDIVGVGATGQVYDVDDDIVLKAGRIYEPPSDQATPQASTDYASETIFHAGISKDEKIVMGLLQKQPHRNIVQVIETVHPEGVYLRKYERLPVPGEISQSDRIRWYQDIIRALSHIHYFKIAHCDIRKDLSLIHI